MRPCLVNLLTTKLHCIKVGWRRTWTQIHRENAMKKRAAEIGVRYPQAKECQEFLAVTGNSKRDAGQVSH